MEKFVCRVCGHNKYESHQTISGLFHCGACGVIFTAPELFSTPVVNFIKISGDAIEPRKLHSDDAGYDLYAAHDVEIASGTVELIKTDIAIELPPNHEAQVRCRSGLGKRGIQISNSPGTIDAQYRGNVGILLFNSTDRPFPVFKGDRVAQLVIKTAVNFSLKQVAKLGNTDRATGGFGHTGINDNEKR